MPNGLADKSDPADGSHSVQIPDLAQSSIQDASIRDSSSDDSNGAYVSIVISDVESGTISEATGKLEGDSPRKAYLSKTESSHEQCRVCQQDKEEILIELGCHCRGELAKSHQSCISTWFHTKGSNKCEICQEVAQNVPPPEPQTGSGYWVWRVEPSVVGESRATQEYGRGYLSPLWMAFSIMIGCLILDVLISTALGVPALPVNVIIGIVLVLGVGIVLRLVTQCCQEWSLWRVGERRESNIDLG